MEFCILGPLTVRDGAREIDVVGSRRRSLLTLLLVHANRVVATDRLVEDLWDGAPPDGAVATLHRHIAYLRRTLSRELLRTRDPGYLLVVGREELDATVFETAAAAGIGALGAGDAETAVDRLSGALALWRGPALGDVAGATWAAAEVARLGELRAAATECLLDAHLRLGRDSDAVKVAEEAVTEYPLRERLWARFLVALYRSGRQADALRAYQRVREHLAAELRTDRSGELQDLERLVVAQDPSLARAHPSTVEDAGARVAHVRQPPSGTLTFLFTDIEGSTRRWEADAEAMRADLARHDLIMKTAIARHDGFVFATGGDGFAVAFPRAGAALSCAAEAQRDLRAGGCPPVRMALHTGEVEERDGDYFGRAVNRAARLMAIGHGGQVLVSLATRQLVSDVVLRDLGEHRLRDLSEPERVFQLVTPDYECDFAPLSSLSARSTNLPMQLTSLVGREADVKAVAGLLAEHRFVTLTGSAGAGKTRLALQVAAEAVDGSGDGTWLVELGPINDADRVASAVAATVGVRETARPAMAALVDALADREILIVLDNCEHVIDTAAKLADALLRACPGVKLVATSREPLRVGGERIYRVPSLAVPEPDAPLEDVLAAAAVRLFVDRAQLQIADFSVDELNARVVGAIVRRLDGIPLAVELAAARLPAMTVDEIAARLDQRFRLLTTGGRAAMARQQTLQGAIDWSYELLSDVEQLVLCRAAVFAGGFDLGAAEWVLADGSAIDAFEVVDIVGRLVDKSLLQRDVAAATLPRRFRMLESIRDYAAARLAARDTEAVAHLRRRHLAHYLHVASVATAYLNGPDFIQWNDRIASDHENLITALNAAVALPGCAADGIELASLLNRYWRNRGNAAEVIAPLSALCDKERSPSRRASGLSTLAALHYTVGALQHATEAADEAVGAATASGDPHALAEALGWRAFAAALVGQHAIAVETSQRACAAADETDDLRLRADVRETFAIALAEAGNVDESRAQFLEAIELDRRAGDVIHEANELMNIAELDIMRGDTSSALESLQAAEAVAHAMGGRHAANHHQLTGLVATARGDDATALQEFGAAVRMNIRTPYDRMLPAGLVGYAQALVSHDREHAAMLLGAADALQDGTPLSPLPIESRLADETRVALEASLPRDDLLSAYERGRGLTPTQILAMIDDHAPS